MTNIELYHHGVKGQKWGVRRYQNKDGTRTAAGKQHQRELNGSKSSSESKDSPTKFGNYSQAVKQKSYVAYDWESDEENELWNEAERITDEINRKASSIPHIEGIGGGSDTNSYTMDAGDGVSIAVYINSDGSYNIDYEDWNKWWD